MNELKEHFIKYLNDKIKIYAVLNHPLVVEELHTILADFETFVKIAEKHEQHIPLQ